jgi:mycofactocin system glycosyltransferase
MSSASPPPATLRVRFAPRTSIRDNGRLLIGGTPGRLVRLRSAAADAVIEWRAGGAVGEASARRALARRLLDAGILVPDPASSSAVGLTVIVPTHGRAAQLDRCLGSLRATAPDAELVVVDDGSPDPEAIAMVAAAHGAAITRHSRRRGPAAARNTGAAATGSPLLGFVDSDVVVEAGCLGRLAAAFADPATGIVAPRVRSLGLPRGAVAAYEAEHSSLDMAQRANLVRPGGEVSYVPSTTLVVRREAFGAGFDEALEVGEDVDFVWRTVGAGWNVWFDPSAEVGHEHRTSLPAFAARRFAYAASIGPLARRHPEALPGVWADSSVAVVIAAVSGRPRFAALALALTTLRRARTLPTRTERPVLLSSELSARSVVRASRSLARIVTCVWWPVLVPALPWSRRGRALFTVAWFQRLVEARPRRPADVALTVLEDILTTLGTWQSCWRSRTAVPLLPSVRHGLAPAKMPRVTGPSRARTAQ